VILEFIFSSPLAFLGSSLFTYAAGVAIAEIVAACRRRY